MSMSGTRVYCYCLCPLQESIATVYVRHKCLLLVSMFGTSVYFYCICPLQESIATVYVRYKSLLLLSMSGTRVYCYCLCRYKSLLLLSMPVQVSIATVYVRYKSLLLLSVRYKSLLLLSMSDTRVYCYCLCPCTSADITALYRETKYISFIALYIKCKAIPLQPLTGPEGSSRLRLSDFKTIGT
jgi:hypothetical protein